MDGLLLNPTVPVTNASDKPLGVSIIIPCHNCGATLEETIDSILTSKPNIQFEVIMVNDSPDDAATRMACATAMRKLSEADINASLYDHDKNKGVSAARNTALQAAQYRYTWPVDSDDMLPPDSRFIDKAVATMERDPNTVFVYPVMQYTGALNHKPLVAFYNERDVVVRNSIPCCTMYRTNEALEVGGYDENVGYGEDQELGLAMLANRLQKNPRAPRRVRRLRSKKCGYLYRQHTEGKNITAQLFPAWTWESHMAKLVTRGGPLFDLHYGTRDPESVRRAFKYNVKNVAFTAARRVQSCLLGERPLSHLFRVPNLLRRGPKF